MLNEPTNESQTSKQDKPVGNSSTRPANSKSPQEGLGILKLPGRYFQHELGVEVVPEKRPSEEDPTPLHVTANEKDKKSVISETELYRIEEVKDDRVSKIELKTKPETSLILGNARQERELEPIVSIVKDCLANISKNSFPPPEGPITYSYPGLISYQAKDESGKLVQFIAAPNFVGKLDEQTKLPPEMVSKISDLEAKLAEKSKNIPADVKLEDLNKQLAKLAKEQERLLEKAEQGEFGADRKSPQFKDVADREAYSALKTEIVKLAKLSSDIYAVRDISKTLAELKRELPQYQSYTGVIDGEKDVKFCANGLRNISAYKDDKPLLTIAYDTGLTSDQKIGRMSVFSITDYRADYPTKTLYPELMPNKPIRREHFSDPSQPEQALLVEEFDRAGRVLYQYQTDTGIGQRFENGVRVESFISNHQRFFENFSKAKNDQHIDELLLKAAKEHPVGVLNKLMDLPASSALRASELAVANLDGELLASMSYRLSSKDSLTSGEKLSPEQENRQAEVLEMLEQRSQMLKDGKLLTNFVQTDNEARFLSLWNDPSTRPYFAIKDEWLKLDQAELDSLGKVANTKLEKGDIKLVLSRILFQKGLEVNEANVAVALGELRSSRDKFGSLDLIAGRNVVFGAHSDTLVDTYSEFKQSWYESSGDYHQFGKAKLIDDIRKRQGENTTFTLIRTELDTLPDRQRLTVVLTEQGLKPEVVDHVLDALENTKASERRDPHLLDLVKLLEERGVEFEQVALIAAKCRGESSAILQRLQEKKAELFEAIVNTPPPMTLIFEGHGGPDGLYLSDGALGSNDAPVESDTTTKITSAELAELFKKRLEKFGPSTADNPDIVIFQSCYNGNFTNKLADLIPKERMPIVLGSSEFNQLSLYSHAYEYGSLFLSDVLGLKNGLSSKIGDFFERQLKPQRLERPKDAQEWKETDGNMNTNPHIHVPSSDGTLIQIGLHTQEARTSIG